MEGWNYAEIIVFIAFSELFYGLDGAVFTYSSRFWICVHTGALDNTLTRPLDSRVRFLLLNVDYLSIILAFVEFMVLLLLSGKSLNIVGILFGVLVVVGADLVLSLLRLCGSYLSFWHGRMNAVSEISGECQVFCVSFKKKFYGEGNLPICIPLYFSGLPYKSNSGITSQ